MNIEPWSYTKLTTFERCPRLGHARYVAKTLPYVETEATKLGNKVHGLLEGLIEDGNELPPEWAWLADFVPSRVPGDYLRAEQWFGLDKAGTPLFKQHREWYSAIDATGAEPWIVTKIDLLQIEANDVAWFLDWKTGKPWEDPDQLNIEAAIVKAHYPHLRHWRGMYVWLKERRVGEVHTLTPARTLDKLRERVAKVDTTDAPKKNKLCPWCTLETCEFYTGGKGR